MKNPLYLLPLLLLTTSCQVGLGVAVSLVPTKTGSPADFITGEARAIDLDQPITPRPSPAVFVSPEPPLAGSRCPGPADNHRTAAGMEQQPAELVQRRC